MSMDAVQATKMFKALDDVTRVKIVEFLTGGEQCACMLLAFLDIAQPTLSHHMRILCESGLVSGRKVGKWMYYSLSKDGFTLMLSYLDQIKTSIDECKADSCGCSEKGRS